MQVIWAQLNFTEILINFFGVVTPRIKKLKLDAIWFMPNVSFVVHGDTFFYLVDVVGRQRWCLLGQEIRNHDTIWSIITFGHDAIAVFLAPAEAWGIYHSYWMKIEDRIRICWWCRQPSIHSIYDPMMTVHNCW